MLLEKGGREDVGGNAAFSGGLFLFRYDGPEDLMSITKDVEPGLEHDRIEAPPYTAEAYTAELMAMSGGRADPALVGALAQRSLDTVRWLAARGVRFVFNRTLGAQMRDGVLHVPPGQVLTCAGAGMSRGFAVIEPLLRHAERIGVEIRWSTPLAGLVRDGGRVTGAVTGAGVVPGAVMVATGGFQASPQLRLRHLGPDWASARLRGTRLATGDGITAAIQAGATPAGDWSRCHSAAVDPSMPSPGSSAAPPPFPLPGFWLGVLVNTGGERLGGRSVRHSTGT